jgi:hypothetical protein
MLQFTSQTASSSLLYLLHLTNTSPPIKLPACRPPAKQLLRGLKLHQHPGIKTGNLIKIKDILQVVINRNDSITRKLPANKVLQEFVSLRVDTAFVSSDKITYLSCNQEWRVGGSHLLVASSIKRIFPFSFRSKARARQNNCCWPWDRCISPALVSRPPFVSMKSHKWTFSSVLMISSSEIDE